MFIICQTNTVLVIQLFIVVLFALFERIITLLYIKYGKYFLMKDLIQTEIIRVLLDFLYHISVNST